MQQQISAEIFEKTTCSVIAGWLKNDIFAVLRRILQLGQVFASSAHMTELMKVCEQVVHVEATACEQEGRTPHGAA